MALTIICPNLTCRSVLQVPESARGRRVRCGKCGKNFLVPAASNLQQARNATAPAENSGK